MRFYRKFVGIHAFLCPTFLPFSAFAQTATVRGLINPSFSAILIISHIQWTRLSCHDFDDNQVRLQLFAMAYNIGNFLRRLALPKSIKDWSLRTMREKLVKIGAKVVSHARYVTFQMAEVLVSKRLFQEILERIHRLKPVPIGHD